MQLKEKKPWYIHFCEDGILIFIRCMTHCINNCSMFVSSCLIDHTGHVGLYMYTEITEGALLACTHSVANSSKHNRCLLRGKMTLNQSFEQD